MESFFSYSVALLGIFVMNALSLHQTPLSSPGSMSFLISPHYKANLATLFSFRSSDGGAAGHWFGRDRLCILEGLIIDSCDHWGWLAKLLIPCVRDMRKNVGSLYIILVRN